MDMDIPSGKQHPYDNWNAVTGADFVTLFIKTWFAFVSTLRELYPQHKPYYEASGDSPFIEAYKSDFASKFCFLCPLEAGIKQNIRSVYEAGLVIISNKYPHFIVTDFYSINYTYSDKYEEKNFRKARYGGPLCVSLKCISKECVKVILHYEDKKFIEKTQTKYNLIEEEIRYSDFLDKFIEDLKENPRTVAESELIGTFYNDLFRTVSRVLVDALGSKINALPSKGYSLEKKVLSSMQAFCRQAITSLQSSCMNFTNGAHHNLLTQMPIPDFLQKYDKMSSSDDTNAFIWFCGFVYRLRNALFHEILDPLDVSWQAVFKNAYFVLKHIVDANVTRLRNIVWLEKAAKSIYEEEFKKDPPSDIPIDAKATFSYNKVELMRYDKTGAKVHISSNILCQGVDHDVQCDVQWDEGLKQAKVKHVEIDSNGDCPEKNNQEDAGMGDSSPQNLQARHENTASDIKSGNSGRAQEIVGEAEVPEFCV